jgi:hypothetical protein
MPRLIVEAVSGESNFTDILFHLELFVSVSDANTGIPVSGLRPEHFRLCSPVGKLYDMNISTQSEANWNLVENEGSGCYSFGIAIAKDSGKQKLEWIEGEYYPFGIQVCFTDDRNELYMGQTVVRIQSLGK